MASHHPHVTPLILVEGFLCAASASIWGDFRTELAQGEKEWKCSQDDDANLSECGIGPRRPTILASIGPVSSLHDRACELFYSLRGGQVDYGQEHSKLHGHDRFGRIFHQGKYPQWGEFNIVTGKIHTAHFIGHSFGGPTIYKLQQLLRQGFFDDALRSDPRKKEENVKYKRNAMILSILAISSPFRGTPIVHLLGEEPTPTPLVRRYSVGDLIAKSVHLITFIQKFGFLSSSSRINPIKHKMPDLFADQWPFAQHQTSDEESWLSLPRKLIMDFKSLRKQWQKSDWAEGRDCAPWDCTVFERLKQESASHGQHWGAYQSDHVLQIPREDVDRTWYCTVAAYMTTPQGQREQQDVLCHQAPYFVGTSTTPSPLTLTANWIGKYDYSSLTPVPAFWREKEEIVYAESLQVPLQCDSGYSSCDSTSVSLPASGSATPRRKAVKHSSCVDLASIDLEAVSTTSKAVSSREAWLANDGVVPLASQFHPRDCGSQVCSHRQGLPSYASCDESNQDRRAEKSSSQNRITSIPQSVKKVLQMGSRIIPSGVSSWLSIEENDTDKVLQSDDADLTVITAGTHSKPNHYYNYTLANTTHATLCPLWIGSQEQTKFWRFVGGWLKDVEMASERR